MKNGYVADTHYWEPRDPTLPWKSLAQHERVVWTNAAKGIRDDGYIQRDGYFVPEEDALAFKDLCDKAATVGLDMKPDELREHARALWMRLFRIKADKA